LWSDEIGESITYLADDVLANDNRIETWSFTNGAPHGRLGAMSLLLRELEAFVRELQYCGELDGGVGIKTCGIAALGHAASYPSGVMQKTCSLLRTGSISPKLES
jgi:hypothetical protein